MYALLRGFVCRKDDSTLIFTDVIVCQQNFSRFVRPSASKLTPIGRPIVLLDHRHRTSIFNLRRHNMSIATGAMSSYIFCSCHLGMNKITPFKVARSGQPVTVADTRLEGALEGWKRELSKKIRLCKDSNDEFLRKFVPSNAPTPPKHKLTKLFDNWRPEKGKEVESYPGLVRSLSRFFWPLRSYVLTRSKASLLWSLVFRPASVHPS